jgi:hypothetical protein
MNGTLPEAIICGFGDVGAGVGGLAWDLGEPGALLLSDGQAQQATFAIEEGGDVATLAVTAGDVTLEGILTPKAAPVAVATDERPSPGAGLTVTACTAEVRSSVRTETLRCFGQISRWTVNPLDGAGTFRYLAIEAGGGTLLIAAARGEPSANGHGEERTWAGLLDGEDTMPFEEALISTQYDGGGDPTRFGLELWPEDAERASRAAATRVSGSALGGVEAGGSWAGLFRCHTDGAEGLGSYLLWLE